MVSDSLEESWHIILGVGLMLRIFSNVDKKSYKTYPVSFETAKTFDVFQAELAYVNTWH